MKFSTSKVVVLVFAVVLAGCDIEDRVRSVIYNDTESAVPTSQDDEESRQERTVEGGERPETATKLPLNDGRDSFLAEIETSGDTRWFELTGGGDEAQMIDLVLEPESPDFDPAIYLELAGDDGQAPLRYDVAGAGESEEIPMLGIPADRKRRFSVTGADGTTGSYQINIRPRLSAATVAMAPGDTPEEATELEVPGEVQGFYDRPHDRDVFFVPGDSLRAGIYSLELSAVPGLEQRLQIFGDDELETPLIEIPVGQEAPAVIPNLSLDGDRGDDEGLYFVLSARDESYHRERGYRLRLVEHPDLGEEEFTVEREPNNTPGSAQNIEFGETVRGYFHTADDVDRFRLTIDDPDGDDEDDEEADQEVDGDETDAVAEQEVEQEDDAEDEDRRPKPVREMLGEQREFEEGEHVDDEELEQRDLEIVNPWEGIEQKEPHEYVVQVRLQPLTEAHRMAMSWLPAENTGEQPVQLRAEDEQEELVVCNRVVGPGEYDVEVESVRAERGFRVRSYDYELEVLNIARKPGLEVPPNDDPDQADRLEKGTPRTGFIARDGEVDYYAFVVGPDEPRLIEEGKEAADDEDGSDEEVGEDSDDGSGGGWEVPDTEEVRIHLQGNPLDLQFEVIDDEGGRVARVDDGGPGADEELGIDLPHGLYYVAVRADSGSVCEPYGLKVTTP